MRSVLITGTSSGIGLDTTVELARRGWRVHATMRDLDRREKLDAAVEGAGVAGRVELRQLDVTDPASIERAAAEVLADTGGALDAVVHNAGIAIAGAFEDLADADTRAVMETNFFGVLSLTRAVLPTMREQRNGRIVVVSSNSAASGEPAMTAYCASKWAVEGWAESLAYEVEPFGIQVILVEPGAFATDIWENSGRRLPDRSAYSGYMSILAKAIASDVSSRAGDPVEVARVIARALDSRRPNMRQPVGRSGWMRFAFRGIVPARALRIVATRELGLRGYRP